MKRPEKKCIHCNDIILPAKGRIRPYKGVCDKPACIYQEKKIRAKNKQKKVSEDISEWDVYRRQLWKYHPNQKLNGDHHCEECGKWIGNAKSFSTEFKNGHHISHILSKKMYPKLYYHPWNVNLLCAEHHRQWDGRGLSKVASEMKIYETNMQIIDYLLSIEEDYDYKGCPVYNNLMSNNRFTPIQL